MRTFQNFMAREIHAMKGEELLCGGDIGPGGVYWEAQKRGVSCPTCLVRQGNIEAARDVLSSYPYRNTAAEIEISLLKKQKEWESISTV